MPPPPFTSPLPLTTRLAVTFGMSLAGAVAGALAGRALSLSMTFVMLLGAVTATLLGALAWRSPEMFFKDRS